MRIVTFTAIAVALISPSGSSSLGHGRGQVDGGSSIDTFASQGAEVYGRGQVGVSSGSIDVLFSSGAEVYGRGQIDAAQSIQLFYPSDIRYGRGQIDAAQSIELFYPSDIRYGRGQIDAAQSIELFTSSSAEVYGRGQIDAAQSIQLFYPSDIRYGRGQIDAAGSKDVVTTAFTYGSNGDTNDVLNFIGKNYDNAGTWANPHTAGRVVVSYSTTGAGVPANLVDRATNAFNYTNTVANSWFAVDLGAGKTVMPNYYSIRHDGETGYYLRNWKLQGSNDAVATASVVTTWTDLDTRTSDTTIAAPNAWGSWAVTGASSYRWLRVVQTGLNANGDNYLIFGELQVYGTFTY